MKAVMLSIQPKWCELIANGKKTIEVRKTKPKNDITHISADFYHYFASDLEVIGNIHNNPELLEGGVEK